MGAFSKKIALLVMGFLAAAAETDLTDASCLETANDDAELMKVQLLQSDLLVRKAKARNARKETEAGSSQDGAVLDAKVEQITDKVEEEQLDAKVDHITDKVEEEQLDAKVEQITDKVEEEQLDAKVEQIMDKGEEKQLDAKVEQITDKVEVKTPVLSAPDPHDASIAPLLKKAAVLSFRVVNTMDVFHLLKQYPAPVPAPVPVPATAPAPTTTTTTTTTPGFWGSIWNHFLDEDEVPEFDSVWDVFHWYYTVQMLNVAISLAIITVIAVVYRCVRADRKEIHAGSGQTETEPGNSGDWSHGLFACLGAPDICLVSWCCPGIRWSETMGYVPALSCCGASGFWGFMNLWSVFVALTFATFGCPFLIYLFAERRGELRRKANIGGSFCMDCVLYCCGCWICALTQEAREVEDAIAKNSKLVGEGVGVAA